ncbi:MAG: OmpP1/FadL family transporter [Bacteroidota bacterium]
MKLRLFILPAMLVTGTLVLPTKLLFASGFQINEHGARGMAQGGAFAARASDPSAIFYNPAGLGFLGGMNIQVGTTLFFPSSRFRGPLQFNTNAETKMVNQVFYPSTLYGTYSMENGFAFGLGVFSPYGLGSEWPSNWVGRGIATKTDLKTFYINPTVAYKVLPQLSIGAGFDFVFGSVVLQRQIVNFNPEGSLKLEGSGTGIGFNAGVLFKPSELFSMGVSYRSTVKLDLKGTATFTVPDQAKPLFPGGDVSTTMKMPSSIFAGLALFPMSNLALEFDYQWVGWKVYDVLPITFSQTTSAQQNTTLPQDYKNSYILRVGGEYLYKDWAFRAGFIFDKTPVPDKSLDPMLPDADHYDYNIGVGYKVSQNLTLDFAYMFASLKQRSTNLGDTQVGFDGTYNTRAHLFALSVGYHFE